MHIRCLEKWWERADVAAVPNRCGLPGWMHAVHWAVHASGPTTAPLQTAIAGQQTTCSSRAAHCDPWLM